MTAVHETIDSFPDVSQRLALPDSRSFTHLVSGGLVFRQLSGSWCIVSGVRLVLCKCKCFRYSVG